MKCNMPRGEEEDEEENDDEIQQLKQKIHLRRQQIQKDQLQSAAQTSEGECNACLNPSHFYDHLFAFPVTGMLPMAVWLSD